MKDEPYWIQPLYIQQSEAKERSDKDLYPEVNRVFGNIDAEEGNHASASVDNKGIEQALQNLNDLSNCFRYMPMSPSMFSNVNQLDSAIAMQ